MNGSIRVGRVNTYDEASNTATVYYEDRGEKAVTSAFTILAPFGIKQVLRKGEEVLVLHMSNAEVEGMIVAPTGALGIKADTGNGDINLTSTKGLITGEMFLQMKADIEMLKARL